MLDDLSGSSLFINITKNRFYKLLTKQRHLNLWAIMMAIHGITVCYGNFKSLMTSMILFIGLKEEHVKLLFENLTAL